MRAKHILLPLLFGAHSIWSGNALAGPEVVTESPAESAEHHDDEPPILEPTPLSPESGETPEERPSSEIVLSEQELLPLFLELTRATDPKTQLAGLERAAQLAHPFLIRPIRYLLSQSTDPVRAKACETLTAFRDINVLPDIFSAIAVGPDHVAERCTETLGRFPLPGVRRKLFALASSSEQSKGIRLSAIRALNQMGTHQAARELERLRRGLQDSTLIAAAREQDTATERVDEPKKLFVLRRLMNPDRPVGRQEATAQLQPVFSQSETHEFLHLALRDPMPQVRKATLEVARSLPKSVRVALLKTGLEEANADVVQAWSSLFSTLEPEQQIPLLVDQISPGRPEAMRLSGFEAMKTSETLIASPVATDSLIELFANQKDPLHGRQAELLAVSPRPEGTQALLSALGKVEEPLAVRDLALSALIKQPADVAVAKLVALTSSEPSEELRVKAADALVTHFCEELGDTCRQYVREHPSEQAEKLLIATSAAFGASSLALLSETAGGNQPLVAGFSGAFLGGGSTYLLGLGNNVKPNQTFHYASLGIWGTILGASAAGAAGLDSESQDFKWLTLGGQLAGVYLGATTLDNVNRTSGELAFANLSGIEMFSMSSGLLQLFGNDETDPRKPYLAALSGFAFGAAPGWLFGPDLRFSNRDKTQVVYSSLVGASMGGLLGPVISNRDQSDLSVAGVLAGQGLGYLGGLAASQLSEITPGRLAWMTTSSAAGAGLGFGVSMLLDPDADDHRVASATGIALGTLGAGLASEYFDLESDDYDMAFSGGLSGALLGALVPTALGEDSSDYSLGSTLTLGTAGFMAGLVHDHLNQVRLRDSLLTAFGTSLGVASGITGAYLFDKDVSDQRALGTGGALGTASLVTLLAMAPDFHFDGGDEKLVLTSMAASATVGSLLPAMLSLDSEGPAGAIFGLGAGFAAGLTWSQLSDYDESEASEIFFDGLLGGLAGGGLAILTPSTTVDSQADAWVTSLSIAGGLTLGALTAPKTEFDREDQWLVSFGTLYGGFAGSRIPYLWTQDINQNQQERSTQSRGGAMLGAALMGGAAMGVSQQLEFSVSDVQETALGAVASNLLGAGIGLLLPASEDDPRGWTAAMTGVGLLGTAATAWVAPTTDFSEGDRTLGLLTTGFSAWQGVGATLLMDGTDRQVAGAALATTAVGAFAGAAISQHTSLTTPEVVVAFSGAIWGAWIGGMGTKAMGLEGRDLLGGYYVGSDIGILLSGLALSPLGGFSPSRVGWINLAGLTGMATGSALGAIFPQLPFWTTNVSFSALGLLGGTIWTHYNPQPDLFIEDEKAASSSSEMPSPFGEVTTLVPQVTVIPSPENEPQVIFGFLGILD